MSIISINRFPVKPHRRTPRPDAPFGAGLVRFVEPSPESFDVEPPMEPDLDAIAYDDFCRAMTPPPLVCRSCGGWTGVRTWGMCPDCFERAADDATVASANYAAGLGYRVF